MKTNENDIHAPQNRMPTHKIKQYVKSILLYIKQAFAQKG